jgi:hypothetical protein
VPTDEWINTFVSRHRLMVLAPQNDKPRRLEAPTGRAQTKMQMITEFHITQYFRPLETAGLIQRVALFGTTVEPLTKAS